MKGGIWGKRWENYTVVFLGAFHSEIEDGQPINRIRPWIAQAVIVDKGKGYAYAEMYRPPNGIGQVSINLVGYVEGGRDEAVKRAARGFKLLSAVESKRGRPMLDEGMQNLQRQLTLQAEKLKRDYPTLSWDHVAARVGVSPATLRIWRKKYC